MMSSGLNGDQPNSHTRLFEFCDVTNNDVKQLVKKVENNSSAKYVIYSLLQDKEGGGAGGGA